MATYSNSRIQLRIDTEANWNTNNPTIAEGELCLSSDKKDFKIGAGALWRSASYWIAQNPTVVSIGTTANNAASTASQALSRANQAISTAQAAAQSAGRVVNFDVIKDAVSNSQPILVDEEFLKTYANTDLMGLDVAVGTVNEIDISNYEAFDSANEVRFYLYASENFFVKSSYFAKNFDAGKILLDGDASYFNGTDSLTFPADSTVELSLINGCVLKYRCTTWS